MVKEVIPMVQKECIATTTIINDRYGGSYSGGAWVAFNLEADEVPWEVDGGDDDCDAFWCRTQNNIIQKDIDHHSSEYIIGLGKDPNEAYSDLIAKLEKEGML